MAAILAAAGRGLTMITITFGTQLLQSATYINIFNGGIETSPAITAFANGTMCVAWQSSSMAIQWSFRATDGSDLGSNFGLTAGGGAVNDTAIAGLSNGNVAVVYRDSSDGVSDIRLTIVGLGGVTVPLQSSSLPIKIADSASLGGEQSGADVTALAGGGFVVTWSDSYGPDNAELRFTQFAADGRVLSTGKINDDNQLYDHREAKVVALTGGGWAVAWTRMVNPDFPEIVFKTYDRFGAVAEATTVVDATDENVRPSLVATQGNGFAIAYMDTSWSGGSGYDVTLRRFTGGGDLITGFGGSGAVRVNAAAGTVNNQGDPTLAVLDDGTLVVGWNSDLSDSTVGSTDLAFFEGISGTRLFGYGSNTPGNAASLGELGRIVALPGGRLALVTSVDGAAGGAGRDIELSQVAFVRTLTGDGANDTMFLTALPEVASGGQGNDAIFGVGPNDSVDGGEGTDAIGWLASASGVTVNLTNQSLNAGQARGTTLTDIETYNLTDAKDVFTAATASVSVIARAGNDIITGSDSADSIDPGAGNDIVNGGGGSDSISSSLGADRINGGDGSDRFSAFNALISGQIDLTNQTKNSGEFLGDSFLSVENYLLTLFGDTFRGTASAETVNSLDGNDKLYGTGGADSLYAGNGTDLVEVLDLNMAVVDGGEGIDTLRFKASGLDFALANYGFVFDQFEILDIRGTGANAIVVTPQSLIDVSPDQQGGEFVLRILRNGDDVVDPQGTWTFSTPVFINGVRFIERYSGAAVLQIEDAAPFLLAPIADRSFRTDAAFSFGIASAFTDAEAVLNFSAVQKNGSALPSWLSFSNGVFSGKAPIEASPLSITVRAFDGFRATTDTFVLSFTAPDLPFLPGANNSANNLVGTSSINKGKLGSGNDIYLAKGGRDIVLGGAGNDRIDGGSSGDGLYGEAGTDTLIGGSGNDRISGGLLADILTGGTGKDTFLFNTYDKTTDRITDFASIDDIMHFDNYAFAALGKDGALVSSALRLTTGATNTIALAKTDTTDKLIYNKTTGALYYDADSKGGATAVKIAQLAAGTTLALTDFLVV